MTFDPDRRSDLDDPIRRRMADGEGSGWAPAAIGAILLLVFGFVIFGNWAPSPENTRESSVRTEKTTPAPAPKAPN